MGAHIDFINNLDLKITLIEFCWKAEKHNLSSDLRRLGQYTTVIKLNTTRCKAYIH